MQTTYQAQNCPGERHRAGPQLLFDSKWSSPRPGLKSASVTYWLSDLGQIAHLLGLYLSFTCKMTVTIAALSEVVVRKM